MPTLFVLLVYSLTLFLSALLLFLVQPMIGKMIMPYLGGTPAVWNTCMVFFQAALLAGYTYAHLASKWLGTRRHAPWHLGLLLLPLLLLPINLNKHLLPEGGGNPIVAVLFLLLVSVGLPFFAVSTTAPLLQKWFSDTGHPSSADPYFLYGASNVGSILALVLYPTIIEDWDGQEWFWVAGYVALVGLTALCAIALLLSQRRVSPLEKAPEAGFTIPDSNAIVSSSSGLLNNNPDLGAPGSARENSEPGLGVAGLTDSVPITECLRWVALAFVPSSFMLAVNTKITTDVPPTPLLWVISLGLYLISFIVAFSRIPILIVRIISLLLPPAVLAMMYCALSGVFQAETFYDKVWIPIAYHLAMLFLVALVCHGELAASRPATKHLTGFYLLMSLGGVLGGIFAGLLAPLIFASTLEYSLSLIFASFLLPWGQSDRESPGKLVLDMGLPIAVGALAYILLVRPEWATSSAWNLAETVIGWFGGTQATVQTVAEYFHKNLVKLGLPLLLCLLLAFRPLRLGLGIGMIVLAFTLSESRDPDTLVVRNYFGIKKVEKDTGRDGERVLLMHGTTWHGMQYRKPEFRSEPTTYYHKEGPIGIVYKELDRREAAKADGTSPRNHAIIGLGAGTMACYARSGDRFTFYEIDKAVKEIAEDPDLFTYLHDARQRGATIDIVLGDARIQLDRLRAKKTGEKYGLIAIDAFSSDAIPVHLITRQAMEVYRDLLAKDGLLMFHISNRHFDLEPVLYNLARDAGFEGALIMSDGSEKERGKFASTWVILSEKAESLGELANDSSWSALKPKAGVGVWTDTRHNIFKILQVR